MKDHPIIFRSEMVRAILDGRKTQTRRIVKPQPKICPMETRPTAYPDSFLWRVNKFDGIIGGLLTTDEYAKFCPYGQVGDRLWVRETYARWSNEHDNIIYCDNLEYIQLGQQNKLLVEVARKSQECSDLMECVGHWVKVPSIFMPKWAARIFLEITNIRVERLQDISLRDLRKEGLPGHAYGIDYTYSLAKYVETEDFKELWDSLNAKRGYGWDKNPWVWVIEFKKL